MELPKRILHKKLNEEELIELLENLEKQKTRAIKNQEYQRAAEIRDQERKYREQLEDLMNPKLKSPKTIHVIGLGGAGSNILVEFHKQFPTFKYTMITDPVRNNIPEKIHFIHYIHHFPFMNTLKAENEIIPEELVDRIDLDQHLIILTGLGGATGTLLTDQLIQFCINSGISFQVGCTWPIYFEGPKRFRLAEEFQTKYADYPNIFIAKDETEIETIKTKNEQASIGDLFASLNKTIIDSVSSKLEA